MFIAGKKIRKSPLQQTLLHFPPASASPFSISGGGNALINCCISEICTQSSEILKFCSQALITGTGAWEKDRALIRPIRQRTPEKSLYWEASKWGLHKPEEFWGMMYWCLLHPTWREREWGRAVEEHHLSPPLPLPPAASVRDITSSTSPGRTAFHSKARPHKMKLSLWGSRCLLREYFGFLVHMTAVLPLYWCLLKRHCPKMNALPFKRVHCGQGR